MMMGVVMLMVVSDYDDGGGVRPFFILHKSLFTLSRLRVPSRWSQMSLLGEARQNGEVEEEVEDEEEEEEEEEEEKEDGNV